MGNILLFCYWGHNRCKRPTIWLILSYRLQCAYENISIVYAQYKFHIYLFIYLFIYTISIVNLPVTQSIATDVCEYFLLY